MNNTEMHNTQGIAGDAAGQDVAEAVLEGTNITGQDAVSLSSSENYAPSLRDEVALIFKRYFDNLEGETVTDFYQLFLSEFEPALFESVMKYTRGNQTKAAAILSVNRGTLRKKLKMYGML